MKAISFILGLLIATIAVSSFADDRPRNLSVNPLTTQEQRAYRAAKNLARKIGLMIKRECVNVNEPSDEGVVTIQFYYPYGEDGPICGDLHNSIRVEFDLKGQVARVIHIDS